MGILHHLQRPFRFAERTTTECRIIVIGWALSVVPNAAASEAYGLPPLIRRLWKQTDKSRIHFP